MYLTGLYIIIHACTFYLFLQIDPTYEPAPIEHKVLFGLTLEQQRNNAVIDKSLFTNVVSSSKEVTKIYMYHRENKSNKNK